jgi:hypothetical protein
VVDEPLYAHFLRCSGAARPYRDLVLAAQDNDGERVFRSLLAPRADQAALYAKHMAKQAMQLPPALLRRARNVLLVRPAPPPPTHPTLALSVRLPASRCSRGAARQIRDPEALVRSFARVLPPTLDETGFPALVSLFSALRSEGAPPAVILSEDLTAAPEATLRVRTRAPSHGLSSSHTRVLTHGVLPDIASSAAAVRHAGPSV